MSSKTRKEIERLVEGLDDVPITSDEAREVVDALGIDMPAWTTALKAKIAAAEDAKFQARVAHARAGYEDEARHLASKKAGPADPAIQQQVLRVLLDRLPPDQRVAFHGHKFEKTTPEEVAETIKSLRHLLGEPDEED